MKAIVFLADGFEEIEALSPVDYLRRSGVEVTTVSVLGNSAVHGAHKVDVIADCSLKQFIDSGNIGEIDAVVVPGGMPGTTTILHQIQKPWILFRKFLIVVNWLQQFVQVRQWFLGRQMFLTEKNGAATLEWPITPEILLFPMILPEG